MKRLATAIYVLTALASIAFAGAQPDTVDGAQSLHVAAGWIDAVASSSP